MTTKVSFQIFLVHLLGTCSAVLAPATLNVRASQSTSPPLVLPYCCKIGFHIVQGVLSEGLLGQGVSSDKPICQAYACPKPAGGCSPETPLPLPPLRPNLPLSPLTKVAPLPCTKIYFFDPQEYPGIDDFYINTTDGSLVRPAGKEVFNTTSYCLDYFPEQGRVLPALCFREEDEKGDGESENPPIFYSIGMILSLPFLLATLFVYSALKELRNLHGLTVISHVAALLLGYFTLLTTQLATNYLPKPLCTSFGYMIQYGFLATFFWLNVMSFDIWLTFSGLRTLVGSRRDAERKKFIAYSIYAWGVPLLIVGATLFVDYTPMVSFISPFKPKMGKNRCFFKDHAAYWLYLYGPMAILLLSNIVMFAITSRRILLHTRETSVLNSRDSSRTDKNEKKRFYIYLKLFLVMGINWSMEIISGLAGGPREVWYLTDVTNTLQGVFIAFTFIWKRRLWLQLKAKFCPGIRLWRPRACCCCGPQADQPSMDGDDTGTLDLKAPSTNGIDLTDDSVRLKDESA